LIAEFMGLKPNRAPYQESFIWDNYADIRELADIVMHEIGDEQWYIYPRFHESWDWLMPVVEKILSSDMYHKIGETETSIVGTSHMSHVKTSLMSAHILTVYEAVVEFIKWYNKNKTL